MRYSTYICPAMIGLAVDLRGLAADIEEAVAREIERRVVVLGAGRHRCESKHGGKERHADRGHYRWIDFHCYLPSSRILGQMRGHDARREVARHAGSCYRCLMSYETILVETKGRVGVIRLNRPQALNALNSALNDEAGAGGRRLRRRHRHRLHPDHRLGEGVRRRRRHQGDGGPVGGRRVPGRLRRRAGTRPRMRASR